MIRLQEEGFHVVRLSERAINESASKCVDQIQQIKGEPSVTVVN